MERRGRGTRGRREIEVIAEAKLLGHEVQIDGDEVDLGIRV